MRDTSAEGKGSRQSPAHPPSQIDPLPRPTKRQVYLVLVACAAFGLYWFSSFVLDARDAAKHFGADVHLYAPLAQGQIFDRVARFHPVTVAMALVWMDIFSPLAPWISPNYILKAMFAAVGAIGIWAALSAFASVVPRGYVTLYGMIYASSFGVWYFSSIEESKIVTVTLSTLYIALYLRLRERWNIWGAVLLTAVLMLACLNEIVSCFLIVIPLVDTLQQRGRDWRHIRWIALHGLAAPIAFGILEGLINDRLVAAGPDEEGRSHLSMLILYVLKGDHSAASLYSFLLNWLLFNIAAPTPFARYEASISYGGYFEPALANYFTSPVRAGAVALLGIMLAVSVVRLYGAKRSGNLSGILLALIAYGLVRGVFFFVFNPVEPLLFSPAVTLAHVLMLSILFTSSEFPAKRALLAAFVVLLFVTNGAFIFGYAQER